MMASVKGLYVSFLLPTDEEEEEEEEGNRNAAVTWAGKEKQDKRKEMGTRGSEGVQRGSREREEDF